MKPIVSYIQKIRLVFLTALCLGSIAAVGYAEELRDPALDPLLEKVKAAYNINLHYAEGPPIEIHQP